MAGGYWSEHSGPLLSTLRISTSAMGHRSTVICHMSWEAVHPKAMCREIDPLSNYKGKRQEMTVWT